MTDKTQPLTSAEKEWVKKLEKVLCNPPTNRLGLYTIGDHDLVVYDRSRDAELRELMSTDFNLDFCQAVEALGAGLGNVGSACEIGSTSG